MQIIGAGMSGLLAAHMLRRFQPVVYEAQESLPNNHAAVLRFRSDVVSRATGIPFKKVWVQKAISYKCRLFPHAGIQFQNMYSAKVTGKIAPRSIMNLEPGERWVAPENFIEQMARGLDIEYGVTLCDVHGRYKEPNISTIPMPAMMNMVGWKDKPSFNHQEIAILTSEIVNCDVYQTLYYPGEEFQYRASITGNKLMIEIASLDWFAMSKDKLLDYSMRIVDQVMRDFGLTQWPRTQPTIKVQKYGKIVSTDNFQRKQFILALTDRYNIYSLGRFATWRQVLMDDVCGDVKLIEQMITERSSYVSHLQLA